MSAKTERPYENMLYIFKNLGEGGGGTVFSIRFYMDISLVSRCNSEIKVWGHLCKILVVFEVPARPLVKEMSGHLPKFDKG